MVQLKAFEHNFNEDRGKSEKYSKTIQVPQKDLKLSKAARTAADNSNCLHSNSFEINTDKSQFN